MGSVLREYSEGTLTIQTRKVDGVIFGHHLERVAITSVSGGGSTFQGTGNVSISSATSVETLCKIWVKSIDGDEVLITSSNDLPFADGQQVQLKITSFGEGQEKQTIGSLVNISSGHRIYLIARNAQGTDFQDHPVSEADVVDWQTTAMKDSVKAVKAAHAKKMRTSASWPAKIVGAYTAAAFLGGWYFGLWVWLTWIPGVIIGHKFVSARPEIIAHEGFIDRYYAEAKSQFSLLRGIANG